MGGVIGVFQRRVIPIAALVLFAACSGDDGGPVAPTDPVPPPDINGIYYHTFSGALEGREWLQITTSSHHVWEIRDLRGGGSSARWAGDGGGISFFGAAVGSGDCTSTGCQVNWSFGTSQFSSTMSRVPGTDASFPIGDPATAGNAEYAGDWSFTLEELNPADWSVAGSQALSAQVAVSGSSLRITLDDGRWYEGEFVSESRVSFRVVEGANGVYASRAGSATSESLDMIGVLDLSTSSASGVLLLQTRAPVGEQSVAPLRLTGTR